MERLRLHARQADIEADWYASQPIPPRLLADLYAAPIVPEWMISRIVLNRRTRPSLRAAEVIACAANGMTEKATAAELHMSPLTVKTHRRNSLFHLGANNITHAVTIAIRRGIIE